MYRIKNFERLLMKNDRFDLVVKNGRIKVKRNLLEALANIDYVVEMPKLYKKITENDKYTDGYLELKIIDNFKYTTRHKSEENGKIVENQFYVTSKDLYVVSINNCVVGSRMMGSGRCEVVRKRTIGSYIVTSDGDYVMSLSHITSYPTVDKILKVVLTNISEGITSLEVFKKLPLADFCKDFKRCDQDIIKYVKSIYSNLCNKELNNMPSGADMRPMQALAENDINYLVKQLKSVQ